jgi:hypothetical protein
VLLCAIAACLLVPFFNVRGDKSMVIWVTCAALPLVRAVVSNACMFQCCVCCKWAWYVRCWTAWCPHLLTSWARREMMARSSGSGARSATFELCYTAAHIAAWCVVPRCNAACCGACAHTG